MTDVSQLDDLAAAIATSSPKIRDYAIAQAAATQDQELRLRALEGVTPPPPPPPPPTGTLIWNGDFETGDDSQYSGYAWRAAADRFRVCTSADGVNARQGHMARVEVRQGEHTNWSTTLSATLIIKAGLPIGIGQPHTETFTAWSAYIPRDWPWSSGNARGMHSTFIEYHGAGSMEQAPFHWGIHHTTGRFYIDLHRAQEDWHPIIQPEFEKLSDPGMADRWHDYVVRHKWSNGSDGRVTFWRDGDELFDWSGPTAPASGERIKFQAGAYAANAAPATKHLYLDEIKIGTSYSSVQPG